MSYWYIFRHSLQVHFNWWTLHCTDKHTNTVIVTFTTLHSPRQVTVPLREVTNCSTCTRESRGLNKAGVGPGIEGLTTFIVYCPGCNIKQNFPFLVVVVDVSGVLGAGLTKTAYSTIDNNAPIPTVSEHYYL